MGDITPHGMLPLLPHHRLEVDDVRSVEAERPQRELLHLAVEDYDAAAMWDRCRCRCYAIAARLPREPPPYNLRLMEESKVDVPLRHPTQGRLQPPFRPFGIL